ncbi:hypothetical protein JTB14_012440 [Gonioctena quinquepunctata]|nr:hypothetical protein JTB14_012440 [Gonioctena quinquepunctata]
MKCVLLLSLVALCYSLPTIPGRSSVNFEEDGTISVIGADGRKVVISRAIGNPGPKNLEIRVSDPNGSTKTIKVDRENNLSTVDDTQRYKRSSKESKKGKSQADILAEIFEGYQGVVDEKTFVKILNKIQNYIKSGDLDPSIYEVLKNTLGEYYDTTPEGLDSSMPVGNSQQLALLKEYLKEKSSEQQWPYATWYGVKQPVTKLSQEPGNNVLPYLYRTVPLASGINEEYPQYRDIYGQETPMQHKYQQWESLPYQYLQSQVSQRLPWDQALRLQQWLDYQPYVQSQKQVLAQPQQKKLYGQDWVLPKRQIDLLWNKLQEQQSQQMNLLGRDWPQQKQQMDLPWNKAQEQQQVWNLPQEQPAQQQWTEQQYTPYEQEAQQLPWNWNQSIQRYQPMNTYGQDWALPKRQIDLLWNKLQEQQSQQMNLLGRDWLLQKQQMDLPWNKAQEQQQYYEPEQVWNLPQEQPAQQQWAEQQYTPYEQKSQQLPWNWNQFIQKYYPWGNYWQQKTSPLQWRQWQYPLNTPVVPVV